MKVLVAEDDPGYCRVLQQRLQEWGFDTTVAANGNDAWQQLQNADAPKLAIIDWVIPGQDGLALCKKLRQSAYGRHTYVILMTGKHGEDRLIDGLKAGADIYMSKPSDSLDFDYLQACLKTARRIVSFQENLASACDLLKLQSMKDSLTGTWNHSACLEMLCQEITRSARRETKLCIGMADLDHFKRVNDTYGHQAGDEMLRQVVSRMNSVVRPYDTIGRYGGEEFLVILPECQARQACQVARRMVSAVSSSPYDLRQVKNASMTVSVGLAVCSDPKNVNAEALIGLADQALYRAKHSGRDRVEISLWPLSGPEGAA
ncbi:MAG: diguanylate cyclase [Planctomycetes bacterium]|nr:diguanylate cyclase [Planctomycetota bacterium]